MSTVPTKRPAPLSRERVLVAAVELADAEGLAAVSMRGLSGRLGVVPMALYKHVRDKDDLAAGMIDSAIGSYPAPPGGLPWDETITLRLLAARDAVVEHGWLRPAIEAAPRPSLAALAHLDAVAGDFAAGGFTPRLTHYAMHALGSRIWGFGAEGFSADASRGQVKQDPASQPPEALAPKNPATRDPANPTASDTNPELMATLAIRFPHVAAIAADAASHDPAGACDEKAEFEFILRTLLAAFARLRDAG